MSYHGKKKYKKSDKPKTFLEKVQDRHSEMKKKTKELKDLTSDKIVQYIIVLLDYDNTRHRDAKKIQIENINIGAIKKNYIECVTQFMKKRITFDENGINLFFIKEENGEHYIYFQCNQKVIDIIIGIIGNTFGKTEKTEKTEKPVDLEKEEEDGILDYVMIIIHKLNNKRKNYIPKKTYFTIEEDKLVKKTHDGSDHFNFYIIPTNKNKQCQGSFIQNLKEIGIDIFLPSTHEIKPSHCFIEKKHIYHICANCFSRIKKKIIQEKQDDLLDNFLELKDVKAKGIQIKTREEFEKSQNTEVEKGQVAGLNEVFEGLRLMDFRKRIPYNSELSLGKEEWGFGDAEIGWSKRNKTKQVEEFKNQLVNNKKFLDKFEEEEDRVFVFEKYMLLLSDGGINKLEAKNKATIVKKSALEYQKVLKEKGPDAGKKKLTYFETNSKYSDIKRYLTHANLVEFKELEYTKYYNLLVEYVKLTDKPTDKLTDKPTDKPTNIDKFFQKNYSEPVVTPTVSTPESPSPSSPTETPEVTVKEGTTGSSSESSSESSLSESSSDSSSSDSSSSESSFNLSSVSSFDTSSVSSLSSSITS
jgi:hypothetical protein